METRIKQKNKTNNSKINETPENKIFWLFKTKVYFEDFGWCKKIFEIQKIKFSVCLFSNKTNMVITPKQVRERLSRVDLTQLKTLEKQIDNALVEGNFNVGIQGGMNLRVKDELIHKYSEAGWEVSYLNDQKQGEYLFFQEQKRRIGFR